MKPTTYFLYARKSSEDEERQAKSIEDQLSEISEFSARLGIHISKTFVESKSAKTPGREIFNDMIAKIKDSKEPVGLLAWHPDRLARNSIDGGQIIYLVDTGKITAMNFPTFWFEPTPQGLFMLQIAFGQSKYYSDNLSENVRRGNRNKVRRGEWLGSAPFGYIANQKLNNIEPDPLRSKIVKRIYEEFVNGNNSLLDIRERLCILGYTRKDGRIVSVATVRIVLSNPAYIGLIRYKGEFFEGKFEPIISQHLFDTVQLELKRKSLPRRKQLRHVFPFTTLFKCGECGCGITAQFARGHGGLYAYYRCTKRRGKCSQSYIRKERFTQLIKNKLEELKLSPEWCEKTILQAQVMENDVLHMKTKFLEEVGNKIISVEHRLDMLVNAFLDTTIDKESYLNQKLKLIKRKMNLQKKREDNEKSRIKYVKPLKIFIDTCNQSQELIKSNNHNEIRGFLLRTTTNRMAKDKKLSWDWISPFDIINKPELVWEWESE